MPHWLSGGCIKITFCNSVLFKFKFGQLSQVLTCTSTSVLLRSCELLFVRKGGLYTHNRSSFKQLKLIMMHLKKSIALITACMAHLHAFYVIIHPAEKFALHHSITIKFHSVLIQTWNTFRLRCVLYRSICAWKTWVPVMQVFKIFAYFIIELEPASTLFISLELFTFWLITICFSGLHQVTHSCEMEDKRNVFFMVLEIKIWKVWRVFI